MWRPPKTIFTGVIIEVTMDGGRSCSPILGGVRGLNTASAYAEDLGEVEGLVDLTTTGVLDFLQQKTIYPKNSAETVVTLTVVFVSKKAHRVFRGIGRE